VYALNTFLSVSMIVLAMWWRRTRNVRWLRLAALAFGLALGVHYVTAGIVAVAAAILIGRVRIRDVAPFVLIGLLAYAYLPIAASRDPAMNWGNPTSVSRFIDHVTAKQYQQYVGGMQIARPARIVGQEFPLVLVAGLIGLAMTRDRGLQAALLAIIVANTAWVIIYPITNDLDAYLIPIFIALIISASTLQIRSIAVLMVATTFILSYHDRSHETAPADRVLEVLARAAPGATIVTGDWELISPLLLLHPERHVVQTGLLIRTWYLDQLTRREHLDVSALRPLVAEWEHGKAPSPALVVELNRFMFRLVTTRRVYVTRDVFASRELSLALAELKKRGFIR
jgi:hypothetical protein